MEVMDDMEMQPQEDSKIAGCIGSLVSWAVKLIIVLVVIVGAYMTYVAYTPGVDKPDWLMKGYTNKHYRTAESHMKKKEYELAIHEYEKALESGADNEAMVYDSRMNIAWCYEQIAQELEPLTWDSGPEASEARAKRNEANKRALEIYNQLISENRNDKTATQRRDLLMLRM
jgi:tetratricopeptide (TPR) repeat protein